MHFFKRNAMSIIFLQQIFFLREFQPIAFTPDDSSLSSDQNTNQFLV